jgi:hypothetical protein
LLCVARNEENRQRGTKKIKRTSTTKHNKDGTTRGERRDKDHLFYNFSAFYNFKKGQIKKHLFSLYTKISLYTKSRVSAVDRFVIPGFCFTVRTSIFYL